MKSLGLSLFSDETFASNTVTAVRAPEGIDVGQMRQILRDEHAVIVAGGQQRLDGKIFRIGHLGLVEESDMEEVVKALRAILPKMGYTIAGASPG